MYLRHLAWLENDNDTLKRRLKNAAHEISMLELDVQRLRAEISILKQKGKPSERSE